MQITIYGLWKSRRAFIPYASFSCIDVGEYWFFL